MRQMEVFQPSRLLSLRRPGQKKKAVLTWDEHQIEEHDQLRGTRMKIDEPDTPFAYANSNDGHSDAESSTGSHRSKDKELNWAHLENKLGAVAAVRDGLPSSPSMSSCGGGNSSGPDPDSDFELEKDKKRKNMKMKEFEMHRKTHYNEFEAMRKWRDATHDDDDE